MHARFLSRIRSIDVKCKKYEIYIWILSSSLRYHLAFPRKRMLSRKGPAPSARSNFVVGNICSSRTLSCYSTKSWTRWQRRRYIAASRGRRRSWGVIYPLFRRDSAAPDPSTPRYHDRRRSVSAADEECWTADRTPPTSAACKGWCRTISSTISPLSRRETAWTRWSRMPRGCSSTGEWPPRSCRWGSSARTLETE